MSERQAPTEPTVKPIVVTTPEHVHAWVDAIRASAGDDEIAHSTEDDLHQAVLRAIADGTAEQPQRMASIALQTLKLDFSRWKA